MDKISMGFYKHSKQILAGIFLLAAACIYFITHLNMSYDIEAFFPVGDPDLDFYQEFRERFEPDDNFLLVAINDSVDGVFRQDILEKVDSLTTVLKDLPYVTHSYSLTNFYSPLKTPFGLTQVRALHIDDPERYTADSARIMRDERLVGKFISVSGKALNIVLKTKDQMQQDEAEAVNTALFETLEAFDLPEFHVAGRANIQAEFVRIQIVEIASYTVVCALMVLLVLMFIFRRPLTVIIALLSVFLSLIIFLGVVGMLGIQLDFMSSLFPILMLIVGMSDVIHILSRYIEEVRKGREREKALRITIREIGMAIFLTSLTTAIGFSSLVTAKIIPIRHFGLTAALGVFVAYVVTIVFIPCMLSLFKPERIISVNRPMLFLEKYLQKTHDLTVNRPVMIAVVSTIVLVLSIVGLMQVSTEARLSNDLPNGERITEDFYFFEREFGGFRPLEAALMAQNGFKLYDREVLEQIEAFEDHVRSTGIAVTIISPTTIVKSFNMAFHGNRESEYKLPETDRELKQYLELLDKAPDRYVNQLVSKDKEWGRLSGSTKDIGSYRADTAFNEINQWIAENVDSNLLKIRLTGTAVLFDNNNKYLVGSLFQGLGLAFLIVSVVMMLLFRNWKMVIISLIPNVMPLLFTAGVLGYMGISLDAPTTIIFTIAFGIAVDDTIHFLSRYKIERDKGNSIDDSLHAAMTITGKAIILTTIVLFMGFMLLITSSLNGTFKVGVLISLTLVSAVIADLFIIPVLVRWFIREER